MSGTYIEHNGRKYSVRYTCRITTDGKQEIKEHILEFNQRELNGKNLDDVVRKFKIFINGQSGRAQTH